MNAAHEGCRTQGSSSAWWPGPAGDSSGGGSWLTKEAARTLVQAPAAELAPTAGQSKREPRHKRETNDSNTHTSDARLAPAPLMTSGGSQRGLVACRSEAATAERGVVQQECGAA